MSFIWMICRQFLLETRQKWFCSVWCVDCEWYLLHETKVILFCMACWLWVVPSARDKVICSVWRVDCEWYLLHETKSDFVLYGVLTVSGTFCTRQKVILFYDVLTVSGTFCTRQSDFVLCAVLTVSGTFCTRQKWFCAVCRVDCEWYLLHETKVILCCMVWLTVSGTFCTRQKWFCACAVLTVSGTFCTRQKVILFCMACWLWVVPSARDKVILFCLVCWLWVVPSARDKKWFCAVWRVDCEWYLLHETKVILCCMACWLWVVPSARDKSDFVLFGVLTVSGTFCTRQKWFCAVWRVDCEWYLLHETKVILFCLVVDLSGTFCTDKKWFCAVCRVDCEWYLLHETKVILCCVPCWLWVVPSARDKMILFCMMCWLWVVPSAWDKVILCCMMCWLWVVPSACPAEPAAGSWAAAGGWRPPRCAGAALYPAPVSKAHLIPVGIQLTRRLSFSFFQSLHLSQGPGRPHREREREKWEIKWQLHWRQEREISRQRHTSEGGRGKTITEQKRRGAH